jgi:ABC-type Fe3+ transport system substrate-binding protein
MKNRMAVIAALLFGAISAPLGTSFPAYGTNHQAKQQKLIEAAKKEGVLNIIAVWSPVEATAIFDDFGKAYPFIKVKQTISSGREGFERIRAEFASGRRATDVIDTGIYEASAAGMIEPWKDWFDVFPDTNKRVVDPSLAAAIEPSSVNGLFYRTDLVPRDLQPLTYAKLSDPRLAGGKLGYNIRQYEMLAYRYPKWSDEEIIRYATEVIVPQKPKLCNGTTACWDMLVRGEIWAIPALSSAQYFSRHLPKGVVNIAIAPDVAALDEGKTVVFLKGAPNPNAAKLFLRWMTTDGAQEIFAKFRGRADPYDENNTVGQWMKKHGAKLFNHPESERETRDRELGAMVLRMLGLPVPKK